MAATRLELVLDIIDEAESGDAHPCATIYCEAQRVCDDLIPYYDLTPNAPEGIERRHLDGFRGDPPEDFSSHDAHCWLPAPLEWPFCTRPELVRWMLEWMDSHALAELAR